MTSKNGKKFLLKDSPWHVLFFAIYPVLALLAKNITEVFPGVVWTPLILSVVFGGILLGLSWLVFRNWQRAALMTTLFLVLFFLYGQVYVSVKNVQLGGFFLFRHRTLGPLWVLLGGLGIWGISRKSLNLFTVTRILNIIGLCLLVYPLTNISVALWKQHDAFQTVPSSSGLAGVRPSNRNLPDIYYIILDSYTRSDILQKTFHFDNSVFLNSLEKMGFYVAVCSQSNYSFTFQSLASSLNFNYLDVIDPSLTPATNDLTSLQPLIKHSALRQFLASQGYKVVAFESGFPWTQLDDADLYLKPISSSWQLNEFDYMLLKTTAGRVYLDILGMGVATDVDNIFRVRTTSALAQLAEAPSIKGPKFVFIHLLVPHMPFVFGSQGEAITLNKEDMTYDEYIQAYTNEVIYINGKMEHIAAEIIAKSETSPIIIIQGDHGAPFANPVDRMDILNAYYLPGGNSGLYMSISPVNTFRIVLNDYFGQKLPLLKDVSLSSARRTLFTYTDIINQCSTK